MQTYIGDIISDQRHDTRNRDTDAHSNENILRYNQYAQNRLYALISREYSYAFEETYDVSIVANQKEYTVDDYVAFGTRITSVWYSPTGTEAAFRPLRPTPNRPDRLTTGTRPIFYRRRGETVVLEPTPTVAQGTLRIVYERSLDKLELRRGQISGTPSGTDIDLSGGSGVSTDDEALLVANTYVCVSDAFGTPLLYNGIVSSYNAGTDVLTLTGDVEDYLVTGKTLADLANAYLTIGKYSTTHSKLPDEAEGYFIEWVNRKLNSVDSDIQFDESDEMLEEIEQAIIASYRRADKEVKSFPINDFDLLIPGVD